MGYVEVGGNGSVIWNSQHDRGSHGQAHKGGGWGRDDIPPKGSGDRFTVLINGKPVGDNPLVDTTKIQILWGSHGPGNLPPNNSVGDTPVDQAKVKERFDSLPVPAPSAD